MAAPESTKFQVNFKSPDGTLINLYATTKEELEALLTAAQDFSVLIGSVSQSFGSAGIAAPVRSAGTAQQVTSAGGGHVCKHGDMSYREGTGAKGPWKGYMCAAPKGATDKCSTIWVK
jgi:hypothetical protein